MDRVVAARKLIGELVKAEQIDVRRVEIVGKDLAKLCETLKRPPNGQELGEWLEEHPQVSELSASTALLDELIDRHLADPDAPVVTARNPELERQIRDAPDNVSAYQVYADWLQERTDPLGELIALSIATASKSDDDVGRFERHLKRHEAHFLGGVANRLVGRLSLTWRYGFVRAIEQVGELPPPEVWRQLLALRVCELVEAITFRSHCLPQHDEAIAETAPDSMRELTLDSSVLPTRLLSRPLRSLVISSTHDLELRQETFPSTLERLEVRVPKLSSLVPIDLDVRELVIVPTRSTINFLRGTGLPRLERLTLDLDGESTSLVPGLLDKLVVPGLRHLGLRNGTLELAHFKKLAKLPVARGLRTLSLTSLALTDDAIAPLAGTRGFSALEEIDVSYNELTREGVDTARELARTVHSTRQLRRGSGMEKRIRKMAGTRLQVAEEIADPANWRRAGIDGDIRWGRYRGEADYELFIAADLSRYGCSCPSSIQPCKHVIALALVAERTGLGPAPSHGVETRVASRAGLGELLVASIETPEDE